MANDFENVIDEEIASLHKWQKQPGTDDEAWLVCDIDDESQALLKKITCWYELPGN